MNTQSFLNRYGPWALVTGTSSGIGEQFARLLAAKGLNLIIVARRAELNAVLATELREQYGIEVESLTVDLSTEDFLPDILQACKDKDIGLLVSNAGFGLKGLHEKMSADAISAMLNVNCRAPLLLSHALIPGLKKRRRGGIIFTGSIEGNLGFPWSTSYAATKALVKSLGEGLWGELRPFGVDVLVLAPGSTDTEAPVLQGFKREDLVGIMQPVEVASQGLAKIADGPFYITGWMNRLMMRVMGLMPRRAAIRMLGSSLKGIIEKNIKKNRIS